MSGLLCAVAILAGGAILFARHIAGVGPAVTVDSSPAPFTDLEEAIATRGWHPGWVVHQRPDLPGPYRVVHGTFIVGNDPTYQAVSSCRDQSGNLVAPIELRGDPDFVQMAVHLETADGRITGCILRRLPDPPR